MNLYTDGTDWVIAADTGDARAAWVEHRGGEAEDFEADEWGECDLPDEEMAIWCDENGDPCGSEDDGAELIAKTHAQWVERGRGFLCSTEV